MFSLQMHAVGNARFPEKKSCQSCTQLTSALLLTGGEHRIDNGLLLRSDLHILFDKGYFTVTPEYQVEFSRKLRVDFKNGEEYLRWHGGAIALPKKETERPRPEFLSWHNEHRFIG